MMSATSPSNFTVVSPGSNSPTLTTLICNYNHGKLISEAIEAMLNQSRPADEFIIVDDGSTDDSVSVIRRWIERYPLIRFFQNEKNIGFHASFQRAIEAASSDFVYSGAADDHLLPGFFEGAMQLAAQYPTSGLICGQIQSVDSTGRKLDFFKLELTTKPEYIDPKRFLHEVLMVEHATHSLSAATIFRKQPLLDVGGVPPDLSSWADTFAIHAIGLQHGICYWPHPAMEWKVLAGSLSQTTQADPIKSFRIVDRAVKLMKSDRFRNTFPADYVDDWARRFRMVVVRDQFASLIEANRVIQSTFQSVAEGTNAPTRLVLGILRFAMRAVYFVTYRTLSFVLTSKLIRSAASNPTGRQI
jgi:glycosyltransferase involved in cell wall biosynthesis